MADYAGGWTAIQDALKTRLEAVTDVGNVYLRTPLVRDYPQSAEFKAKFIVDGAVNFWKILKIRDGGDQLHPSDSSRYTTRHDVILVGFYGHNDPEDTLETWDAIVRGILANFRDGDRTLGLACLTHSLPRVTSNDEVAPFMGVNCLSGILDMTIEEIL